MFSIMYLEILEGLETYSFSGCVTQRASQLQYQTIHGKKNSSSKTTVLEETAKAMDIPSAADDHKFEKRSKNLISQMKLSRN